MGFLDKAKSAAEQAAARAKEGVEDVQTKRELGQAYGELGKAAFELIESGEVSHARLEPLAAKVRSLNERAGDDAEPVGATASSDTHDPSQPPAMPT
jgi:outer membrane murein-binding lipoprotein Lpp